MKDSHQNANTEIHKEFCPNCEAEVPCTHEAELFVCDICGEDFAKYIVSRYCNVSDVSVTRDVTTPEPHWEGCEEVHLDCIIAQLENAMRMLADKSIQEYNELVKTVKKVLCLDDFVGDSDHEHDDRIL